MLYEMATGRRAFRRDTPAATLDAIINEEPPPCPRSTRARPLLLRWIIERCLAKNPGDRYGATADLHRDLRTLRDRLAEAIARETGTRRGRARIATWRRCAMVAAHSRRRSPRARVLSGARVAARPDDLVGAALHAVRDRAGYEGFPALSPDGQTIAYAAEVNGMLQIFTRTLVVDRRGPGHPGAYDCKYPFWSPDGKRIYYVSLAQDTGRHLVDRRRRRHAAGRRRERHARRDFARRPDAGVSSRRAARRHRRHGGAVAVDTRPARAPWSSEKVEAAAKRHEGFGDCASSKARSRSRPTGARSVCARFRESSTSSPPSRTRGWQFWVVPLPEGPARTAA